MFCRNQFLIFLTYHGITFLKIVVKKIDKQYFKFMTFIKSNFDAFCVSKFAAMIFSHKVTVFIHHIPSIDYNYYHYVNHILADITRTLAAKRKRLQTFTQASLKSSNRKYEDVFQAQQGERYYFGNLDTFMQLFSNFLADKRKGTLQF